MSALSDYKELVDKAAGLRSALKSCQTTLNSERGRIERWDDKIHDLKDGIVALKWLKSMASTTMLLMQAIVQSMHAAGPSSCPMAPLLAQAKTGLTAQISSPGLASRMDVHPETHHFDNLSGDFANDMPIPDTSMPPGWEHDPNWDSDASVWAEMKGPKDTKASGKTCKSGHTTVSTSHMT
jgi:hypothetical protein